MEQGIDHLVSLSPEKIPPHYAFPDLQHTLIPVEDFTGPTIAEIQKFLEICDCARRDGEVILNTVFMCLEISKSWEDILSKTS